MLFSSADLAQFINDHFEPVWESVRPVPMLTIDFGNGKTVTRTLHGNIATYLCGHDGQVLDIVPGIYTPEIYRQRLDQFLLLHQYVNGRLPNETLREYHQKQAELLKVNQQPQVLVRLDREKDSIEKPIKLIAAADAARNAKPAVKSPASKPTTKAEEIAQWEMLAEDTRLNETVRREQIHRKLAQTGKVKPDQIVKWLYKDVLHADLDDPYLGLGEALFKNYPFAEEEAKTARP